MHIKRVKKSKNLVTIYACDIIPKLIILTKFDIKIFMRGSSNPLIFNKVCIPFTWIYKNLDKFEIQTWFASKFTSTFYRR